MRYLMCPPDYFGVEYVINPWMRGNLGTVSPEAREQWFGLGRLLVEYLGADVVLLDPQPGLPDMVFTANAGLVRGGVAVPTRFRHPERQGEEAHFRPWFAAEGYDVRELPEGVAFEGEGDALFDFTPEARLWVADGFRTDAAASPRLAEIFGTEVITLKLADARYYHLDTCFAPLPRGKFLWYPPAFDAASQAAIAERVPAADRHAVSDEDAAAFACNAVPVGETAVVLNHASAALTAWLRANDFTLQATPLTEFMKAGGAAKCLVLRAEEPEQGR
jgi:N-dimethylarginine dimethylaminohydrolase